VATGPDIVRVFGLWPPDRGHVHVWQLVTTAFCTARCCTWDSNMVAIWMFGRRLEKTLGDLRYLLTICSASPSPP